MKRRFIHIAMACMLAASVSLTSCSNNSDMVEANTSDTVVIDQMKFTPDNLTINKGDTVVFINKDIVAHNAVQKDSAWYSPTLNTGESWSFVPEKSADYYCSIHIVMKGKIQVK